MKYEQLRNRKKGEIWDDADPFGSSDPFRSDNQFSWSEIEGRNILFGVGKMQIGWSLELEGSDDVDSYRVDEDGRLEIEGHLCDFHLPQNLDFNNCLGEGNNTGLNDGTCYRQGSGLGDGSDLGAITQDLVDEFEPFWGDETVTENEVDNLDEENDSLDNDYVGVT
ncbi:hypothetical protein L6452_05642 [Arctium lappa]|uniref:Uncharacterized protein n=1 Tax=Arctium lappa TaxID=4217 RepID=A0ACB9EGI0_ARCLA|nr:hypothetical protein L6452_05642 [Arctium lappa]